MLSQRFVESLVGLFLIFALVALTVLAFKVSGLTSLFPAKAYTVVAAFEDIGGLKVRAPVKISGVQIGEVEQIELDRVNFKANVTLRIETNYNDIPDDSSAAILTSGLLGDNYIAITPMYNTTFLKQGSRINYTTSAMVLEKLIGQFLYKVGGGSEGEKAATSKESKESKEKN
ncbi:MAG TPA: outer membrane lipid asymmetry maintenance protein MlaD [Gammaproteobacteria bacterium]|jgi:phospholipid/cholesterol/gamma-HCH transport system substrate-binding protein|nr:outer membrane lipid asymmetry maintenance protein MlaD [Gammaproteobacteria bacterium]